MGKRSQFERNPRDYYPTPYKAILPLLPHLSADFTYIEPCAGNGAIINHLNLHGFFCVDAFDIEPQASNIAKGDILTSSSVKSNNIITNPPWDRKILHPILDRLLLDCPHDIWFLLDADWAHTKQATRYIAFCQKIISIGRVKWIEDSKSSGKDNCCWYLFRRDNTQPTKFYGRAE